MRFSTTARLVSESSLSLNDTDTQRADTCVDWISANSFLIAARGDRQWTDARQLLRLSSDQGNRIPPAGIYPRQSQTRTTGAHDRSEGSQRTRAI
ncbi:uncharacterized protein Dyak_GE28738 [Drosophila yakuba]|uniref:Uncharacterized protein n=1 Tax=Drosophila yakuba TaxID=7245 RepID=A0A0R1E6V6_DROYA|nr:uncharacterized protein Dyak_GE28738 [Drosophila yakuba]